ncbi:MAG TPA: sulfotransferase [Candidatus Binataceae bacterium]|nr:sulfotransferase [Candidatus Binataceae bacterium]
MAYFPGTFLNLQARLLRGVDRLADGLGLFRAPLLPEELIGLARRREGVNDFGEWSFQEPLAVLVGAYERESNLTAFGRIAVRWDMVRFLSNLLRLREEEKNDPGILDEPVRQPIFILGLPRSGTTFLHNLMAQDPANLVPRCWETIYPYPERGSVAADPDPRPDIVARQFANFLRLVPELPSLHPLDARAAQECTEITGQVVRSLRFDATHYVPSYQEWLERAGHLEAYRFHKRFLQHLQHRNGRGRWVLKSPDHTFALDALRKVYHDARFVFVHRDPLEVLPSVARLTEILRKPFTRRVDRLQIGRQVSDRWVEGANLLIEASEDLGASPERILHVRFDQLVVDPFGTVSALYRHFGLALSPRAEARLKRSIAQRPGGGYGQNFYRLEDYGLNPDVERTRYHDYMAYFGMGDESEAPMVRKPRLAMAK